MSRSSKLSPFLISIVFVTCAIAGRATGPAEQVPTVVIPDSRLLSATFQDMRRDTASEQSRTARDKLAAYARDLSHDAKSRAMAIDFLSVLKSEANFKLPASFFTDPSGKVRTRAFYGLPEKIQAEIGNYDYTRPHSTEEFHDEALRINRVIEKYVKATAK